MNPTPQAYDYIIVGAGSAGCVLARRLSDDPTLRVLLLEAGPPAKGFWVRAPAGMGRLIRSDRLNWCSYTEPVPMLRDRKLYWPRGKGLGGSSSINGMVYFRGNRRDFDHWARLGNTGWSWDEVLPYFKRSEDNRRGGPFHGSGGPLAVTDSAVRHPSAVDFVEAARRAGLPYLEDLNTGETEGAGFVQATIRGGARQSTYEAFVAPVRNRPNLTVLTGVHVRRVLFSGREATGVEVLEAGSVRSILATREVIVSAGAMGSPQLLMLSGVGDGEALQRHGIGSVVHLPGVGKNLQDHLSVRVQVRTNRPSSCNADLAGWRKYWQGARYLATGGGYLAMPSSLAAAFLRSGPQVDYPDLEISFRPMTFTFTDAGSVEVDPYHAISASVYRVRPSSRGEVALRSPDPLDSPALFPNYLSAPDDAEAMMSGLRWVRKIMATQPIAGRIAEELVPGAGVMSDEECIDHIQREGNCVFHPAGTCKMGSDALAVVDERLRVRGVQRLRVVDASIMPTVTSGNTNAPAIMIGEKGADLVRTDAVAGRPLPT